MNYFILFAKAEKVCKTALSHSKPLVKNGFFYVFGSKVADQDPKRKRF